MLFSQWASCLPKNGGYFSNLILSTFHVKTLFQFYDLTKYDIKRAHLANFLFLQIAYTGVNLSVTYKDALDRIPKILQMQLPPQLPLLLILVSFTTADSAILTIFCSFSD